MAGLNFANWRSAIQRWFCRIGWHFGWQPYWDGRPFSMLRGRCPHCGFVGDVDSQGNLG